MDPVKTTRDGEAVEAAVWELGVHTTNIPAIYYGCLFIYYFYILYIIYMPFWKPPKSRRWSEWKPWRQCRNWVCNVHTILTPKSTQKPPESWRWAQWKPPEMVRQLGQCGNWVCIPPTYQPRPSTTPPLPSLSAMQSLICILHCRARVGTVSSKNLVALFMLSLRSCLCPMDWTLSIYMGGKFSRILCGEFSVSRVLCLSPRFSASRSIPAFFIGPRCPWGPIYGSGSLSLTDSKTLCRLNWCDSGWWRYQLNTNW